MYRHKETLMKKSLLSIVTASVLLAGVGLASAESTTTTTSSSWTNDQGAAISQYSTSKHYNSFSDPGMKPTVGMVLPGAVTVYPLPETMQVPDADHYSYGIINNNPVVINRTDRTVVHTWGQ
jgi:hypothetical protein